MWIGNKVGSFNIAAGDSYTNEITIKLKVHLVFFNCGVELDK